MRSRGFGTDPAFAAWRSIAGTPVARTVAASAAGGSVASRGGGSAGPAVVLGRYDSDEVEVGLDEFWQSTGLNTPHAGAGRAVEAESFTMMLPPPNVTGTLHLGHALTIAIQDSLARWHRMHGKSVLWLPGSDHAGIATQSVVEKDLARLGLPPREAMGRDAFVDKVWSWKEDKGGQIFGQIRRLGASLDWSRTTFTMDEGYSAAVTEAFVRLHDKGLLYRRKRLVNWSPTLRSALSDIEVDKVQLDGRTKLKIPGYSDEVPFGLIYRVGYPVHDQGIDGGDAAGELLMIATTRPETMLGDVAVAVHPDDPRYSHLHGRQVVNPVTGEPIPIVLDDVLVDPEFGTGAVKITPAHDQNDHDAGLRHGLPSVTVMDTMGNMLGPLAEFHGVPRFTARATIVGSLERRGLLDAVDDHSMVVPMCSRSGDVIEPMLSWQWYLDCTDMGKRASDAVSGGDLKIVPALHRSTWFDWLDNVHDWCVSRQLWWGHRIPAYRVTAGAGVDVDSEALGELASSAAADGLWVCAPDEHAARAKANSMLGSDDFTLEQDEDVLDTWFSSGLFPFASLGWPRQTADLDKCFPGHLLETGHDILFFWVARMVMMSLELTDRLPFDTVYLHGMVRDALGKKMSKSLGNVIDPMDVINGISLDELQRRIADSNLLPAEKKRASQLQKRQFPRGIPKCGADALRLSLVSFTTQGRDNVTLNMEKIESNRAFCNKIWNAAKFTIAFLGDGFRPRARAEPLAPTALADRWILSRLAGVVGEVNRGFREYNFPVVTQAVQDFCSGDFCDVYIESIKPALRGDPSRLADVKPVVHRCLDTAVRLLAPMVPHIAERLLAALPRHADDGATCVLDTPYPCETEAVWASAADPESEAIMKEALAVVRSIRAVPIRQLNPKADITAYIRACTAATDSQLELATDTIRTLSRASEVRVLPRDAAAPAGSFAVPCAATDCDIFVSTTLELPDAEIIAEINKLQKRRTGFERKLEKVQKRTQAAGYQNAPPKVRAADTGTMAQLQLQIDDLECTVQLYTSWQTKAKSNTTV